jgi:hypothetical protein
MTAPTRNTLTIFNAQVAPGSTTKATAAAAATQAAGKGDWSDVSAFNGGRIGAIVTNGASAPSAPLSFLIQLSDSNDGSNAVDLWLGAGDTVSSSTGFPVSALIPLPSEAKYVRVLAFGNTTNAVGLKVVVFLKA